jgi:hypothetical protein
MFKKIRSKIASAILDTNNPPHSPSGKKKQRYVLEEVFWVPVNNASARDSNSSPSAKLRPNSLDKRKS